MKAAVAAALAARPDAAVRLSVTVSSARVQRYLAQVAKRFDRKPIDSWSCSANLQPFVSKGRPGADARSAPPARTAILADLRQNRRERGRR